MAKYRPEFAAKGFADSRQARTWVTGFVHWYNFDHHSGIRFVSPADRHAGFLIHRTKYLSYRAFPKWN
jgi:putative transposase